MKVLILGGTGFFGKELTLSCALRGDEVTVFSRRCPIDGLPPKIRQVRGDRSVRPDLMRLSIEKWDVIFDNICFSPEDASVAIEAFTGRTGLLVFTSSEAVYYTLSSASSPFRETHTEIFPEDTVLRSKGEFFRYAFGKKDAERVYIKAWDETRFPVSIARFPIVIGPADPTLRAYSYWIRIADDGQILAPGMEFLKRVIYSGDAAKALQILASSRNVSGQIFNFGECIPVTLREWIILSASIMGKKPVTIPVTFEWLKEKGVRPDFSPFSSRKDYVIDLSKAIEKLGWSSSVMRDWMTKTIDWHFMKYSGPPPADYAGRKKELELAGLFAQAQ